MKGSVGEVGMKMCGNGGKWLVNTVVFADNTVLIGGNE